MNKPTSSLPGQKSLMTAGVQFLALTPKVGDILKVEYYISTGEGGQEGVGILVEIIKAIDATRYEVVCRKERFPYTLIPTGTFYLVLKDGWVVIGGTKKIFPVVSIVHAGSFATKTITSFRSVVQTVLLGKEYPRPEKGDRLICGFGGGEEYQVVGVSGQSIFLFHNEEQFIIFDWKNGEKRSSGDMLTLYMMSGDSVGEDDEAFFFSESRDTTFYGVKKSQK